MKIPRQLETEIYVGGEGDLIIRQVNAAYSEEDDLVIIARAHLPRVIDELSRLLADDSEWPGDDE